MAAPQRTYFGTDGVRGPYGGPVMNTVFAARLAEAAGRWFRSARGVPEGARALVGRDTRASGVHLETAVAAGLRAAGLRVVSAGVVPTPAVAFGVRHTGAAIGVAITASHNPAGDNGIKFFDAAGLKLPDEDEAEIERELAAIASGVEAGPPPEASPEVSGAYLECVTGLLPEEALQGWHVVVDCAHGAAHRTTPEALLRLGAAIEAIGVAPSGRNINAGVGSQHPDRLAARVRASGARVGLAHDGDADRVVLVDEAGGVLDGDEVLAILGRDRLEHGRLAGGTLVATVQSNLGLDATIAAAGGRVERTPVGDRYVAAALRSGGYGLGGESSGHIICAEVSLSGDGLVAALLVLDVMRRTGAPLSELRRVLVKYPQASLALTVREKRPLAALRHVARAREAAEKALLGRGRVLVRYSGTEPKLRLLVEGPDGAEVRDWMARLRTAVEADLDVLAEGA